MTSKGSGWNARLFWVMGLALLIRLAFVLLYPQVEVRADALGYDQEASALAFHSDGMPATQVSKGPVYPLFLAASYRIFGHEYAAVRIIQAVISALTIPLLYGVGRRVFGRPAAWMASLLAAVYPPFISYTGWLLTETLSVLLLLAFIHHIIKALGSPGVGSWLVAGILAGVTVLLREEMLVIVVLVAVVLGWWRVGRRQVGTMVVAAALTILPWTLRNYRVFHQFVLVSPLGGHGLWISTHEPEWLEWHFDDPHYQALTAGLDSVAADNALRQEAVKNICTKPLTYLALCARRIPRFWIGGHSHSFVGLDRSFGSYAAQGAYVKVAVKLALLIYNVGLTALGFLGAYLAWTLRMADGRHLTLLMLPVVAKAATHVFLFADLRYQVPIMSFLILFAAFALWHLRCVVRELVPAPA